MKKHIRITLFFFVIVPAALFLSAADIQQRVADKFPYTQAGLTERQAAAHLLNRFSYGPGPGEIDRVVKMGLEKWLEEQLGGKLKDEELSERLRNYDVIDLPDTEIVKIFPRNAEVVRAAIRDGKIPKDSVRSAGQQQYRALLGTYMKEKGYRPQAELTRQFINQKILRASYTNNQLQEVLTDFWFNHFNVSLTKAQCAQFVPSYERDVIRPNVFGSFNEMLLATAKSPAMLLFLDNASSSGIKLSQAVLQGKRPAPQQQRRAGLNENYAREVMELHTLGVDGGYTQKDVTEAARVLTGWGVFRTNATTKTAMELNLEKNGDDAFKKQGYIFQDLFLFNPNRHDNTKKTVLGHQFAAGGGYEEGVQLLELLANHASTAKFISKKLAVRFISDQPSAETITRLSGAFTASKGDLKEMIRAIAYSPEFWTGKIIREKTKSPFELAISTVRALDADVIQPYQLYTWMTKMGQRIYYYQAPTGFPDYGQYWINTGSLLNRMSFGLTLAAQRIPGVKIDLVALNNNHEPESAEAALKTYSKLMMPERDLTATIERLTPLLTDKKLSEKVDVAAAKKPAAKPNNMTSGENGVIDAGKIDDKKPRQASKNVNSPMLAQVVGVIIGSPEFQRR